MTEKNLNIIEAEVLVAQKLWAEKIVQIGKLYLEKGNYRDYAYKSSIYAKKNGINLTTGWRDG